MAGNGNGSDSNNSNNGNWLGFSLSPHLKMELPSSDPNHHYHHHHRHESKTSTTAVAIPSSVPTSFFLPSPDHQLNPSPSGHCFVRPGESGNNGGGGFHPHPHLPPPQLTVMPVKSDGSLCIMEALSRSQPQGMVQNSPPKLENFLEGGATQHHHYHEREAMALSLDSIYYHHHHQHQTAGREAEEDNRHNNTNNSSHPSLEIFQQQPVTYFSSGPCQGLIQSPLPPPMVEGEEEPKDDTTHQISDCNAHITHMNNWISRGYPTTHQGVDHAMGGGFGADNDSFMENEESSPTIGCGDLQSLSLSMSPGSQSSCVSANAQISSAGNNGDFCVATETGKKRGPGKVGGSSKQPVHRKSIDTFGQRTSQYRGVTKHRWTGRYEAHLWDNSCKKEGQTRKGRQVYLGGYDMEEKAARAYDLAALKYWGPSTHINFPLENYKEELEEMKSMTRQEYVAHLRRKSSGFSRGASMYRGVTRHHQHGRWQARIGRVAGNKDLYLGTFSTQEEAAEAYDIAAIKFRGINAVTNFNITRYDVEKIMSSNTLLAGEQAKRSVKAYEPPSIIEPVTDQTTSSLNNGSGATINPPSSSDWKMVLCDYPHQQPSPCMEIVALDHHQKENVGVGNRSPNFSIAMQDLMGIDSLNSTHQSMGTAAIDESNKLGSIQFSNASSIVSSLSSSREGSPCRSGSSPNNTNNVNVLFPRPPPIAWIPSAQLRPPAAAAAISMAHLPVFAAWGDA